MTDAQVAIDQIYREERGRVLANLISTLRDFDLAEDVLQEAFITAMEVWPKQGIPKVPSAWLTTTAKRKAIDRIRRVKNFDKKSETLKTLTKATAPAADHEMDEIPDERLKLIFTCCHPSIALESQVALTLRTLGGLNIDEIARAFLVPRKTMQQRIVRAKRKIKQAGIPYRVPPAHLLDERLEAVAAVLYLIFNAGYTTTEGDALLKEELCEDAVRLGQVLARLLPSKAEVLGLLALMTLHHARRRARSDASGELILLADQDRSLWDSEAIADGIAVLDEAMALRQTGPYQIQAAIAALHCEAISAEKTDWQQIAHLYGGLYQFTPTPIVRLNQAVAIAEAHGPLRGLELLDQLGEAGTLDGYHLFHAARADLLRRAGFHEQARDAYEDALLLTANSAERSFITRRIQELS